MWLNTSRQELRRASGVLRAIQAALSNDVGKDLFTAAMDDEATATAEYERYKARQNSRA